MINSKEIKLTKFKSSVSKEECQRILLMASIDLINERFNFYIESLVYCQMADNNNTEKQKKTYT